MPNYVRMSNGKKEEENISEFDIYYQPFRNELGPRMESWNKRSNCIMQPAVYRHNQR